MRSLFAPLLALALAVGYGWLLLPLTQRAFGSPDANGYFVQATLLVEHGSTELVPASPLDYIGMHFLETADGRFFSRYPPGMGALMAVPFALWGPDAALLLQPLLAAATLWLLFLLVRRYAGDGPALLATLLFALHPLAAVHALNWGAHTAVAFFLVAGVWVLEAWADEPRWWKALAAGLLLGVVPTLRYAEVVAGLGVAAFLLVHVARRRERWPDLLAAIAGAAIPVGLLLWRNTTVFGSPFDTGYALTGEQQLGTGFSAEFFEAKWAGMVTGLATSGLGLFLALGLAGLAGMFVRPKTRPTALLLTLIILTITAAYTAYYWGGQGAMGLRFLLPTLPLWLVPAFWFVAQAGRDRAVAVGLGVVFLAQAGLFYAEGRPQLLRTTEGLARIRQALDFIEARVPDGSALIADRRLAETLQFFPHWRLLDAAVVGSASGRPRPGGARPGGRGQRPDAGFPTEPDEPYETPDIANPMQQGKAGRLRAAILVPDLQKRARNITDLLYDIVEKGQDLFWIGTPAEVEALAPNLFDGDRFEEVASVRLAEASEEAGTPSGMGAPRGAMGGPGLQRAGGMRGPGGMPGRGGMPGPGGRNRPGAPGGRGPSGLAPGQVLTLFRLTLLDTKKPGNANQGIPVDASGKR